jgi:tight adherence protein C
VLPFFFLVAAQSVYVFVLENLTDKPTTVRVLACIVAAYIGLYTPNMFVSNQSKKRRPRSRWPGRTHST